MIFCMVWWKCVWKQKVKVKSLYSVYILQMQNGKNRNSSWYNSEGLMYHKKCTTIFRVTKMLQAWCQVILFAQEAAAFCESECNIHHWPIEVANKEWCVCWQHTGSPSQYFQVKRNKFGGLKSNLLQKEMPQRNFTKCKGFMTSDKSKAMIKYICHKNYRLFTCTHKTIYSMDQKMLRYIIILKNNLAHGWNEYQTRIAISMMT